MNDLQFRYDPPKPSFWRMLLAPVKGDLLCFDGRKWRVARRYGWNWPVEDSEAREAASILDDIRHG